MTDIAMSSSWSKEEDQGMDCVAVFHNLRNPHPIHWKQLLLAVLDVARDRTGKRLETVSSSIWLSRL